jgi:hypothetical protein
MKIELTPLEYPDALRIRRRMNEFIAELNDYNARTVHTAKIVELANNSPELDQRGKLFEIAQTRHIVASLCTSFANAVRKADRLTGVEAAGDKSEKLS